MGIRTLFLLPPLAWAVFGYGAEGGGLVPGAVPGTVRLARSDISAGAGGRFEGHAAWSDREFQRWEKGRDILYFPDIPQAGNGHDGHQFRFQARQSRVWVRSHRPWGEGEINVYGEWDMEETPDSYKFRLRHAYVSAGPVLAGRSYTTFINTAALPDIDSGVAPGEVIIKREQLRWTQAVAAGMELMFALEEPDSRIATASGDARFHHFDEDHIPNLVARLTRFTDRGDYSVSAMARSLRWRGEGIQQDIWAGGIGFSGRFNFGGLDNLRLMLNYGNGLGRYVTPGSYADGFYDTASGRLHRNTILGVQAAYQHFWNLRWRSTLSLGYSGAKLPHSAHGNLIESTSSLQTNLLFSPVPALSVGMEYLHGRKTLKGGGGGRINRILFITRYEIRL